VLAVVNNPRSGEDDSSTYFGYSADVGDLDADGQRNDVAVGTPRGANLNGTVCAILVAFKIVKCNQSSSYR